MAAVAFTDQQKAERYKRRLKAQILLRISETGITKTNLAECLGVSKQTFGYRLKNMKFDAGELYLIKQKLNMENDL